MLEKNFNFQKSENKLIEKIIDDGNINLNHVILKKFDFLPEHYSNSIVYLIIISGKMTLKLEGETEKTYSGIINIPYNVKMNISNQDDQLLEFFIIKSPHPKNEIYQKS